MGIIQSIIIKLKKEKFKRSFLSIGGGHLVLVAMAMEIIVLLVERKKLA